MTDPVLTLGKDNGITLTPSQTSATPQQEWPSRSIIGSDPPLPQPPTCIRPPVVPGEVTE